MLEIDLLIGNQNVRTAAHFDRRDPVTGAIATRAAAANAAEAYAAGEAAAAAFPEWSASGPGASAFGRCWRTGSRCRCWSPLADCCLPWQPASCTAPA